LGWVRSGEIAFLRIRVSAAQGGTTAAAVVLAGGALAATVKAFIEWQRLGYLTVRLELDGSRRWVTISGVHPALATAVAAGRAGLER